MQAAEARGRALERQLSERSAPPPAAEPPPADMRKELELLSRQGECTQVNSTTHVPQVLSERSAPPPADMRKELELLSREGECTQVNSTTHVPQVLTGLISLCTNPMSILSVPIQTVR